MLFISKVKKKLPDHRSEFKKSNEKETHQSPALNAPIKVTDDDQTGKQCTLNFFVLKVKTKNNNTYILMSLSF